MEETIRVVTDTSCDLLPEMLEEYQIEVVPLWVHFGTEIYDAGELTLDEFWEKSAGPHHPTTSQPPVGAYHEVFERLVSQGLQVVCVALTSKHSGTYNSAVLGAQDFDAVEVFDSLSISVGVGLQALSAAQAARAGRSMPEILAQLEDLRERMRLFIVLDTLENLRRGGRAAAFIAAADRMARALNIKVIVNLVEGQLKLLSAARSTKRALKYVADQVDQLGPLEHLAVVHTRSEQAAERFADQLAEQIGFPRERIWVRETGPILSSHGGPGVLAAFAVSSAPAG